MISKEFQYFKPDLEYMKIRVHKKMCTLQEDVLQ